MKQAVFLDRDGVINEEVNYLSQPEQLRLIPGAAEAIARLNRADLLVIVVTNQAGVARGYYSEAQIEVLHAALSQQLARASAHIDRYYYCPHHPTEGRPPYRIECDCRKPRTGMLRQAASDLNLDLSRSYMIGDTASDLIAGTRAGCRSILVQTGYGLKTQHDWTESFQPNYIARDLNEASKWILSQPI
jgi:D-glycero-D-manno-heptose 1,7-bisphosphate phosphatase